MNARDLGQLAAMGEGLTLEFKRKVPRPHRLAKEVIALANTAGGYVLIGVDDDGTVTGLRDAYEEQYALAQAVNAHISPPVRLAVERVEVSRKRDALVVRVPRSDRRPHFLVEDAQTGRGAAYVRVDSMSVEASPEAVALMREQAGSVSFTFGDEEQRLMRYLETYGRITVRQYATLAGRDVDAASHALVMLTRAQVLHHHVGAGEDYFSIALAEE
jgi:predicted HTH transcriptional regulator